MVIQSLIREDWYTSIVSSVKGSSELTIITKESNIDVMETFLEIFNNGITPDEMNAVRGGAADPLCICANGAVYDCGCYTDCTCHGAGSQLKCSCNAPKPDTGMLGWKSIHFAAARWVS